MFNRIGLLLPRSNDYPVMGYEIMEGLKAYFRAAGKEAPQLVTENIGFGENASVNYAKAEKLLLQDEAEVIVAYCNAANAEPLYTLAEALKRPFIFIDSGMQLPEAFSPFSCHISLQGAHACRLAGSMAGEGSRKVLMATSFYDGGYRGPFEYDRGLSESGGSVCGNYVSHYKISEFTIDPYIGLLHQTGAGSVGACFSSYLAELFFQGLNQKKEETLPLPMYCSPFMAEEQLLSRCDFPGGELFTVVPWASSLENPEQSRLRNAIDKYKNLTLFHLLGWEAAQVAERIAETSVQGLKGFTFNSPRGPVTIHPETHHTYAPLYRGRIGGNEGGKCSLIIEEEIPVTAADHLMILLDKPSDLVSGWKNNYLCI